MMDIMIVTVTGTDFSGDSENPLTNFSTFGSAERRFECRECKVRA